MLLELLKVALNPVLPWTIFFAALVWGILKGRRFVRKLLFLWILYSLLLSSSYLAFLASRPLENYGLNRFEFAPSNLRDQIDCYAYEGLIVLGGAIPNTAFDRRLGTQLSSAGERVVEPVRLQRICKNWKLVYSSFGSSTDGEIGESELARNLWIQLGVKPEKIAIENASTNTRENALETSKLLNSENPWLIVTSSAHMRRALLAFEKLGMTVDPIPVDFLFEQAPALWTLEPLDTTKAWNTLIHEYLGLAYYKARNWI